MRSREPTVFIGDFSGGDNEAVCLLLRSFSRNAWVGEDDLGALVYMVCGVRFDVHARFSLLGGGSTVCFGGAASSFG